MRGDRRLAALGRRSFLIGAGISGFERAAMGRTPADFGALSGGSDPRGRRSSGGSSPAATRGSILHFAPESRRWRSNNPATRLGESSERKIRSI